MNKNDILGAMWDSELPPLAKLVFLAILDYRNAKTGECYPNMDTIADKTGMCRNSVASAVGQIQSAGFFSIQKIRPKGTKFTVNSYRFSFECSPDGRSNEHPNEHPNECSPDGHKLIELKEPKKEKDITNVISKNYAFEGKYIRLTQRDLDQWKTAYSHIKDWRAELTVLDDHLRDKPDKQKGWFSYVSAILKNRNKDYAENAEAEKKHPQAHLKPWNRMHPGAGG